MKTAKKSGKKFGTAILCRMVAPLIVCAFDLIRRKVKIKILGREIGEKLKDVIGEVLEFRRNCPIDDFTTLLEGWIFEVRKKFGQVDGKEQYVTDCEDMYSALKALSEGCKDAQCLYAKIDEYFVDRAGVGDDPDVVVLASGHASKGFEWDRVVILRPDLMPLSSARTDADKVQEENVKGVIYTRAKTEQWVCLEKCPKLDTDKN